MTHFMLWVSRVILVFFLRLFWSLEARVKDTCGFIAHVEMSRRGGFHTSHVTTHYFSFSPCCSVAKSSAVQIDQFPLLMYLIRRLKSEFCAGVVTTF
jgi:hypothetical protein